MRLFVFCLFILGTRKRVNVFFDAHLVLCKIFFKLIPYVFFDYPFVSAYRIHIVASTPKFLEPYLYLRFACLSKIIRLLFPLRYPINCATLIYGGILTNICTWSTQASACMISTPFCSHSFRNITPISFSMFHIFLFFCISVRILCDTDTYTLNVMCFLFRCFHLSLT